MKNAMNYSADSLRGFRNPNDRSKLTPSTFALMTLAAGLVLAAGPAQASTNILLNAGFELPPSGHALYGTTVATDWTYFSPPELPGYFGDYWVQILTTDHGLAAFDGTNYWNQWSALNSGNTNASGIYQTKGCAPGSIFQANGWITSGSGDNGGLGADALAWIQVEFLDVNTNLLALYKSGNYSASVGLDTWFQYQVTNACDISQPVSTGDPYFTTYAVTGSVSQLVAPFGTTAIRYRFVLLQTVVKGSVNLDDAVLNQLSGPIAPVINNLFPQSMIFVNPTNGLSFNVSSPSGFTINNSGIQVVLNGTNVSGSLAISGSSSSKNVAYLGLQSNATYTVAISVTDVSNLTVSASTYFQTMWYGIQPVTYAWEAEDWDFTTGITNGMYINNPGLCNASGDPNCYFGKVGMQGVDENNMSGVSGSYRAGDLMGQAPSGDYLRPNLFAAGRTDYVINPFDGNGSYTVSEWVNYTRDWPNSTNWIIARLATDINLSGSLLLTQITPTATNNLGTFTINGGLGYSTFEYVYLLDTNGNNANVVLNGKSTLRVTSGGNLLPNFFMLVAAELDLPLLNNLYPTGKHPFEYTNALSFTVASVGATFPANSIKVILDGNDVSSALGITGSASSKNVVYPTLQPNAVHTAIITVTNSLGHGISLTNRFDTFSLNNDSFEAEDYDFNGGQYVSASDWIPDAYTFYTSVSNIDFQHTYVSGEPTDGSEYQYRANGIPQNPGFDYLRPIFVSYGAIDYQLYWFGASDWANYTRAYPTGSFYAYARSAGLGLYSMELDQVVSGTGTTNQVTKRLGLWSAVGINNTTYDWVPLTDSGLAAPVTVNLGGVSTLRVSTSTGDCYPNFFMLVPATGIKLSATRAGSNVLVTFPTQAGSSYRVFYSTGLSAGSWTLLNTVLGDGTVKSVSDSTASGNQRFYKVTSP